MYNITHNLIAIPISDFRIPLVRPSRHYHPLSHRLITATTDYYKFSFFPRAVFHWNNPPLKTVACSTLKQFNQAVCKIDHVSLQKITILLILNLTCILTYFQSLYIGYNHPPPSLFLALLIFLQLDAHMSRSPTGV